MRKAIMMTGTILIAAMVLISGSAVAFFVDAERVYDSDGCTDPDEALGVPNTTPASLGRTGPPAAYGWIILELNSSDVMPNSQDFTVFVYNDFWSTNESYDVFVGEEMDGEEEYVGTGWDGANYIFQTPAIGGDEWRYIHLIANVSSTAPDPVPGAEIDAVGWDK